MEFQTIDEKFHVIDSDMVPAVVDPALAKAISFGKGDWKLLQKKAVSAVSGTPFYATKRR